MKKMLLIAALLASCVAVPASASANCAPTKGVYEKLTNDYHETRQSMGLTSDAIIETWANTEIGSWTILLTLPNGKSCVVSTGTDWVRNVMGNA